MPRQGSQPNAPLAEKFALCGRPKRTGDGGPCTRIRPRHAVACDKHLTLAERQTRDAARLAASRPVPAAGPVYLTWPIGDPCQDGHDGDDLEALRCWQAGRCAVCGGTRRLVTDHDHGTELVRGLLCLSCNGTEGRNYEDPRFVVYRRRPPAAVLGFRIQYVSAFAWATGPGPVATPADVIAVMRTRDWGAHG